MRGQRLWSRENRRLWWVPWAVVVCCLGLTYDTLGGICMSAETDIVVLPQPLSPVVQEIEVVYIDGQAPRVWLKSASGPPPPPPWRPTGERVDLLALLGEGRPFGGCEGNMARSPGALVVHLSDPSPTGCGYRVELQRADSGVDVLSYDTLHLRGRALGRVTLALADKAAQRRGDNVPLTHVTGDFALRLPVQTIARQLDLRRLAAFVVVPETPDSEVKIELLTVERTAGPRQKTPGRGFWVWEYRHTLAHPETVLGACRRYGCGRLLIQMPALEDAASLWEAYAHFLSTAPDQGIEAFALDGYPEAIHTPEALLHKVRRLRAVLAGRRWAGIQLDIEPYLLADFFVDETGLERYLAVLEQIRQALEGQARLSVVIPFWFTAQTLRGRPVAFTVLDRADEVAVMSYRTRLDELRAITEDILRYGDLVGTPVWLALETQPLPVERHVVLKSEPRHTLADAYVDQTGQRLVLRRPPATEDLAWFRVHHHTTVRPERLTFAGQTRTQVRAAVAAVVASVTHPSLAGMLIHDLDGFLALSE
jgi:hypothetical protein